MNLFAALHDKGQQFAVYSANLREVDQKALMAAEKILLREFVYLVIQFSAEDQFFSVIHVQTDAFPSLFCKENAVKRHSYSLSRFCR